VDAREARPQSVGALTPLVPFEPVLTDPGRLAFSVRTRGRSPASNAGTDLAMMDAAKVRLAPLERASRVRMWTMLCGSGHGRKSATKGVGHATQDFGRDHFDMVTPRVEMPAHLQVT